MKALEFVVFVVQRLWHIARDVVALAPHEGLLTAWWHGGSRGDAYDDERHAALAAEYGLAKDDFGYGEVFVHEARSLLLSLGVGAADVVVDLGCGRGHILLAAKSIGASARGVDLDPGHIIALKDSGLDVSVGDARSADVSDATVVWLSWSLWSKELRTAVADHLAATLPSGARVITVLWSPVSSSSRGYDRFSGHTETRLWCTWGRSDIIVTTMS